MSTRAPARTEESLQKEWWLRVLMVLQQPRSVFEAMRDDSNDAAAARQEPALALVLLGGIAAVLSFSSTSREFLDDPRVDGLLLVAVLAFLGGAIYGFAGYWLGGAALYFGVRGAKGAGSYRQARHILAYALAPLALSLLTIWPVRLAVYGRDNFRTGGADHGAGYWAFTGIGYAFALWSLALLVLGVRAVHGWTVLRSLGAMLLTAMALLMLALAALAIGGTL